jgi:hypothetical protein
MYHCIYIIKVPKKTKITNMKNNILQDFILSPHWIRIFFLFSFSVNMFMYLFFQSELDFLFIFYTIRAMKKQSNSDSDVKYATI